MDIVGARFAGGFSVLIFLIAQTTVSFADDALTGDWGGSRARMEEKGITYDIFYIGDYGNNLSGGATTGSTYLDVTHIGVGLDGDKMGVTGASFFISVIGNQGQDPGPSTLVGDAQGVSNIEAPGKWQLHEAWYEQKIGARFSARLGRYDFNSEFDAIDTAELFLNGSHGIGPDISQTGPSLYPELYPAVRLGFNMANGRYLQTAYMSNTNTTPNDTMLGIEYGRVVENSSTGLRKFALGAWYFTNSKTVDIGGSGIPATNNMGLYGLVETALTQEAGSKNQGLNGYLRYGVADATLNQFASYVGAGLVYTGLFDGRDEDQAGIAVAMAGNGATYKAATATATDSETNIELTYRFQVKPWLAIQPDLQYVIDPGADNSNANASYFAVRAEITL